jgi:hypothetical protein
MMNYKSLIRQQPYEPEPVLLQYQAGNGKLNVNLTTLSPTKCTILFPDILYYNITLNTDTCFDSLRYHHQGITLK